MGSQTSRDPKSLQIIFDFFEMQQIRTPADMPSQTERHWAWEDQCPACTGGKTARKLFRLAPFFHAWLNAEKPYLFEKGKATSLYLQIQGNKCMAYACLR